MLKAANLIRLRVAVLGFFLATLLQGFAQAQDVPSRTAQSEATQPKTLTDRKVGRTADGKPDLNGIWMMKGFNARYYIQPDQLPPFQPGGEARFNAKHAAGDDPGGKCLPFGMPRQIFAPNAMQIIQTPGQVAILYEFEHMFRVISTLGEPHSKNPEPTWNGESVGKWEGDTLVIDTIGLNPDTWMDRGGHMHSDALHLIERYRRLDADTLEGQITIDDPKIFTRPWTVTRTYAIQSAKIAEYICEE